MKFYRLISLQCFTLLCLLFFNFSGFSQSPSFKYFTEGDGLLTQEIYDIHEDEDGCIWLGTELGLFRYDGYEFKNFRCTDQKGRSISQIGEDLYGRIWCANFNGQLLYVENDTMQLFESWEQKGIIDPHLLISVIEDKIYVICKFGVFTYNLKSSTWNLLRKIENMTIYERKVVSDLEGTPHFFFIEDKGTGFDGDFFIGKEDRIEFWPEVHAIDRAKYDFLINDDQKILVEYSINSPPLFFQLDNRNSYQLPTDLLGKGQFKIRQLSDGTIWLIGEQGAEEISISTQGVFRTGKKVLSNEYVTDMLIDREGNYWFSTINSGLTMTRHLNFLEFDHPALKAGVTSIAKDEQNYLLVGTRNGRLLKMTLDGEILSSLNLKHPIKYIFSDKKFNQVFVNAQGGFLLKQSVLKEHNTLQNVKKITQYGKDTLLVSVGFLSILIGQNELDYSYLNYSPLIKAFSKKYPGNIFASTRVSTILVTHEKKGKTVWLGFSEGLHISNKEEFSAVELRGERVLATDLVKGKNKHVWVATNSKGVLEVVDGEVINQYNSFNSPLPDNQVHSICVDGDFLWIGTNNGLSKFSITDNNWEVISKSEGLISNQVLDFELIGDFAMILTSKGLQRIPKEFTRSKKVKPLIHLSEVLVNDSVLNKSESAIFRHDQNNFNFTFVGLNFSSQGNFSYQYRLKGQNDEWITISSENNQIRFPSILPGEYKFEVKSVNSQGMSSAQTASYSFEITKPFWQTWWFYLLSILVIIAIVSGFFLFRLREVNKKNQLEKEKNEIKQMLLRSQLNPHFIFNSLIAVQQYLMQKEPEDASHYLGMFSSLMRQILEYSREEYISLSDEVKMLRSYLELNKMRFQEKFNYLIEVDEKLDQEYTGIPPMFAQPFIENSLEHGLFKKEGICNQINVKFTDEPDDMVKLIIEDTGIGILDEEACSMKTDSLATKITVERLETFKKEIEKDVRLVVENRYYGKEVVGLCVQLMLPTKMLIKR